MKVKLVRIEQSIPNLEKAEEKINKEIRTLESKGCKIQDIKISVVRDAAPEFNIEMAYAFTALILYE